MANNDRLKNRRRGFTLIEMAMVVMILSLLAAAALRYSAALTYAKNANATNATLDVVETALTNFRYMYGRLPCPADITTYWENQANFGIEAANPGACTGGTPTVPASLINSATDPDGTGGSDPGAPDALYDASAVNQVVAGGIPTKTLQLPDKYGYDAWGRRILYVTDIRITSSNAFLAYPVTTSSPTSSGATSVGAIVIKNNSIALLSNAITYKAVYALVSYGANGHGAYVRNLSATPTRFNAKSINVDQLKNCHCDSTAAATTFDRIFVQKAKTGSPTLTDVFDDIVRYKTRGDMSISFEMQ